MLHSKRGEDEKSITLIPPPKKKEIPNKKGWIIIIEWFASSTDRSLYTGVIFINMKSNFKHKNVEIKIPYMEIIFYSGWFSIKFGN